MTDPFPETIEIEVDRDAVRRYLRRTWLGLWVGGLGVLSSVIGTAYVGGRLDVDDWGDIPGAIFHVLLGLAGSALIGITAGILFYLLVSHRLAAREAASLKLTVEGAFLRIVKEGTSRSDRKLHFRSIVDYTVVEDNMMRRFGIKALQMTTTGGSTPSAIHVLGVNDCLKVRDMLAEIDSIRE